MFEEVKLKPCNFPNSNGKGGDLKRPLPISSNRLRYLSSSDKAITFAVQKDSTGFLRFIYVKNPVGKTWKDRFCNVCVQTYMCNPCNMGKPTHITLYNENAEALNTLAEDLLNDSDKRATVVEEDDNSDENAEVVNLPESAATVEEGKQEIVSTPEGTISGTTSVEKERGADVYENIVSQLQNIKELSKQKHAYEDEVKTQAFTKIVKHMLFKRKCRRCEFAVARLLTLANAKHWKLSYKGLRQKETSLWFKYKNLEQKCKRKMPRHV